MNLRTSSTNSDDEASKPSIKEETKEVAVGTVVAGSAEKTMSGPPPTPLDRTGKFAAMAKRKVDMESLPKPDVAKSDRVTMNKFP